jgi:hypothetical protein
MSQASDTDHAQTNPVDLPKQEKAGGFRMLRMVLFAVVGGVLGYGYYRFVGCSSGACPITSNPYISTIYGAVMALMLAR